MPDPMRPIRYGPAKRWTDALHGRRDGRAGIPAKHVKGGPAGPVTTPHREALIRQAQDAFGYEHLEYRRLVSGPHRRIMAERARLEAARSTLAWAKKAYDDEARPLAGPDASQRRLGEEHHPETVIVQRRRMEHQKVVARARIAVTRAEADIAVIEADLAQAVQEAEQQHRAAVTRVQRIHEHIHRRLAIYRRSLVRVHPDGAWANMVLSVQAPEIPQWALPDAYLPEDTPQPAPPVADDGPPPPPGPADSPAEIIELRHEVTRFGSAEPDEDDGVGYVTLDSPVAAPWHFTVIRRAGHLELQTRGYAYGPYIGGEAVNRAILQTGDFFDFEARRYTMLDASRLEDAPLRRCDLIVAGLFAKSGAKARLSDMSFVQREKTLLAILGPSGAGKSSLFQALLGELPPESGRLFFHKLSMTSQAKQIRENLGFVPQKTELHESLTVEATLRHGFGLRSPAGKATRAAAIDRVLKSNKLEKQRYQLLSTLSGGQLRRVSIALELLTNPQLLLLDEPTSGLDANMDKLIMTTLREYAEGNDEGHPDAGHTVIVVTHATEHLPMAHQILVVVENGAPAYSGPPRQIRRHFRFGTYADLMNMLLEQPQVWADKYRHGGMAREARREADQMEQWLATATASGGNPLRNPRHRTPRAAWKRFRVLLLRQCVLLRNRGLTKNATERSWWDRIRNWLVTSLPLIIAAGSAALAALVAGAPGLGAKPSDAGPTALTLLTTLVVLSGQALTYSEVVNELPIIRREFRAGVSAFQVLSTKWLVYSVMALLQASLITVVFCLFPQRGPQRWVLYGPEIDLFLGLAALSVAAMTLGLLVSTLAAKLEHAVALVTLTSIVQIALNGITSDLSQPSATSVLAALWPDRWGVAAVASSVNLRGVSADGLWRHSTGQWSQDMLALAVLTIVFFALAVWRLQARLRPPRPGRRAAPR